ncbi:unnamed protein product [Cuscuta campestris]|uniref:Uncharacterized protein n=1 Tax=Cuscuta campestris TaxID=132261 RepID=A0A484MMQ4_9ASTE|nr:unnamed protein product [Cuscuta campestris]
MYVMVNSEYSLVRRAAIEFLLLRLSLIGTKLPGRLSSSVFFFERRRRQGGRQQRQPQRITARDVASNPDEGDNLDRDINLDESDIRLEPAWSTDDSLRTIRRPPLPEMTTALGHNGEQQHRGTEED